MTQTGESAFSISSLAPRDSAWMRLLSAIQTSETMEFQVLEPLIAAFSHDADALLFLRRQSEEEKRHSAAIHAYLLQHFAYEKTKATLSDRIFYALLLPLVRRLASKPANLISVILFYEYFSVGLYRQLLEAANASKHETLAHLIEGILRDEAGHIKGLRALLATLPPLLARERLVQNIILRFLSLDVAFEPWALHNRSIMHSLIELGIAPSIINRHRKQALKRILSHHDARVV